MKVSVITPTHGRPEFLEKAYRVFRSQTHADKEWLVYDDSPEPHPMLSALRDPDVRYRHDPRREPLGFKRDWLVRESRGEVVAHFDDDDYYADSYLEKMLAELGAGDFVKLDRWFVLEGQTGALFYWDTSRVAPMQHWVHPGGGPGRIRLGDDSSGESDWIQRQVWGYGFTFVYRRRVYEKARFDPLLNFGEDYAFAREVVARGYAARTAADETGLALHVVHRQNCSGCFPNYALPSFLLGRVFGPGVLGYLRGIPGIPRDDLR